MSNITDTMLVDMITGDAPDYIYLAIGCSQKWHTPATRQPQQYPPQIAALPGRKFCILIDPELEAPPTAVQLLDPNADPNDSVYVVDPNLTFVVIRRMFDWPEYTLMRRLYEQCQRSRLIVQDYTGEIIDRHYPRNRALLGRVLFDFTYNDGGCFIDFDTVRILQRPNGDFIQPHYEPIAATHTEMTPAQCKTTVKVLTDTMYNYVQRLYRIQAGTEPYRDWCTTPVVERYAARFFFVYNIPPATDNATLERLMLAVFADLSTAVGDVMVESEALAIIRNPDKSYETALRILRDILAP
jgi:hypothetical protein